MTIAGLDIGTTGTKCTIFSEDGKFLKRFYKDYEKVRESERQEIDASELINAVFAVLKEASSVFSDIVSIGITSFGETFVLTDKNGIPLYPALLYTDPRGKEESDYLEEKLGDEKIVEITGLMPHEMYSLPKIMWLKKHQKAIFDKSSFIFLISDYVAFRLTGERKIDYSLATRTMAFDVEALSWSDTILHLAGLDSALFSTPCSTGSVVGELKPEIRKELGLKVKTEVILSGHDQVAAALGSGTFSEGEAVDGAGTVECITPVFSSRPDQKTMASGYYCLVPYLEKGKYVTYAFSYAGGALLDWCVSSLAKKEGEEAKKRGITPNEILEEKYLSKYGDNPSSLLVLPHFLGAATPYMDIHSRGAIIGLTTSSEVEDIYYASMEGVCLEMKLNIERMGEKGKSIHMLRATGGGASSALWMQMKADILGLPIVSLKTKDAGTVGSALLSYLSLGIVKTLKEGKELLVEEDQLFEPRKEMTERYSEIYMRYRELYKAIRPLV